MVSFNFSLIQVYIWWFDFFQMQLLEKIVTEPSCLTDVFFEVCEYKLIF